MAAAKGQAALCLHAHSTAQRLSTGLTLVFSYAALQDDLAHSLGAALQGACSREQRRQDHSLLEGCSNIVQLMHACVILVQNM